MSFTMSGIYIYSWYSYYTQYHMGEYYTRLIIYDINDNLNDTMNICRSKFVH